MDFSVDNWDDLRLFLVTVRAGSIAAASRDLGLDPTTVSRRMQAFEDRSPSKLFDRLRGGVVLSAAGDLMLRSAEAIESVVIGVEDEAAHGQVQLRGEVRIAVPESMGISWVAPILVIARENPGLSLQLVAGEGVHRLTRREADVAIRVTESPPSHLVGRKFSKVAVAAYGHSALEGKATSTLPWVGWTGLADDESAIGAVREGMKACGPCEIKVNTYAMMMAYLRAGAGITALPCVMGEREPSLRRFSRPRLDAPLWLLTHPDLRRTPRIRVVMDALTRLVLAQRGELMGVSPS